jgi:hypothetical protein
MSVVVLSIAATVVLAGTQTMTPLVALTAAALIMGGTTHPLSVPADSPDFVNSYVHDANTNYIVLTGFCGTDSCTPTAVATPEQFMPVSGTMTFDQSVAQGLTNLDQAIKAQPTGTPIVVFGYSQSARIASLEKGRLAAAGSTMPLSFVLIGNPNRPNGGILERFAGLQIPILGVTFDGATPTNTKFQTVDITRQYDGWSDFPNNPLNPLAVANAAAGIYYVHGNYQGVSLGNGLYQGQYGDTKYYLIPSNRLPLLMPLAQLGVPDPLLAVVDAPLRVLVETGYDRTISPGQPTPAMLLYFPNPVQTGVNFLIAIPTGMDDGAQEAVGLRPFGTQPAGPYGVGGPPVNVGTFGPSGSPAASAAAPAPVASAQVLADKARAPAPPLAPQPAALPGAWQPVPTVAAAAPPMQKATAAIEPAAPPIPQAASPKPLTEVALPWVKPAQVPTPAPVPAEIPKPADIPKIAPPKIDVPTQVPIPAEIPKPVSVPVDMPAPAVVAPEIPAAPAPPAVQAPLPLPTLPQLPELPQGPAPPPLPAPPPMPPMPPIPNIANILGGFRLPF